VLHFTDHSDEEAVVRELAMVKVMAPADQRAEILQISEHFGCKTVDLTEASLIMLIEGNCGKVDACVNMLKKFKIVEIVRTGKVLMARGQEET